MLGAAAILAASLLSGSGDWTQPVDHTTGIATWYGAHCPDGVTNFGRVDTCTPYMSRARGGRGGELVMYAAIGNFKYRDKPFRVRVCGVKSGKCVVVVVRDFCWGATKALRKEWDPNRSKIIDLSPTAFHALAPLSRGILKVRIEWDYETVGARHGIR